MLSDAELYAAIAVVIIAIIAYLWWDCKYTKWLPASLSPTKCTAETMSAAGSYGITYNPNSATGPYVNGSFYEGGWGSNF